MISEKTILLEIDAKRELGLNCFDNNIIADITRCLGYDYKLSLLGGFDFSYKSFDNESDLLNYGDFFTGDILHVPYLLAKFVGVSIKSSVKDDQYSYQRFIAEVIDSLHKNIPVGIGMDSYNLTWNPEYKKLHRMHYFIIIGVDLENNVFYCLDSYLSKKIEQISMHNTYSLCEKIFLVNDYCEKDYLLIEVINSLLDCFTGSGKRDNCQSIRNFSSEIVNDKFLVDKRVSVTDLEKSNFLFRLSDIADSRKNFILGLVYLEKKFNLKNFDVIINLARDVHNDWEIVRRLIIKGYISGRVISSLFRASNILNNIADEEEELLNKLYSLAK